MRWPWTSKARLDDLREELRRQQAASDERLLLAQGQVAWLQEQNDKLTDTLTRLQRREAGLPEVPRAPRPPTEPMPKELVAYTAGFSKTLRRELRTAAFRRHIAKTEPWEKIMADMMPPKESKDG